MIDSIIENSYKKKTEIKKKISYEEAEKNEVFHQINNENFDLSTLINNKVKNADLTINSNIDNLLSYSVVDSDNKKIREQLIKFQKEIISSEPINIKPKKKQHKYLFKGDFTISENMTKTKFKEFSFLNKNKKYLESFSRINSNKNRDSKNTNPHTQRIANKKYPGLHDFNVSKLYSEYAIERAYDSEVVVENKVYLMLLLLSSRVLKDSMELKYDNNYVIDFPVSLFDKQKKILKWHKRNQEKTSSNQTF